MYISIWRKRLEIAIAECNDGKEKESIVKVDFLKPRLSSSRN